MRHPAKASSSASRLRPGGRPGRAGRGALRRRGGGGSGPSQTGRALLAAVVCIATLALAVTTAEADPPGVAFVEYGASYTHVKAKIYTGTIQTSWEFQIISDNDYEENITHSLPPFEGAASGGSGITGPSDVLVRGHFTGLAPSTTYHARLVLNNTDGSGEAELPNFTTRDGTELPISVTGGPSHVSAEHAYLHGSVNPNTDRTAYWFEWGLADCATSACASVPPHHEGVAGEGSEPVEVTRPIGGLQAATTYHYRLVAENTSGTVAGPDQTFETAPAPPSPECPNEAHRQEIHATELPDCRAWELVSPPNKLGVDVSVDTGRIRVAESETSQLPMAATFSSLGGFSDVHGGGVSTEYLSQRTLEPGTSGWSTHNIFPKQLAMTVRGIFSFQDPAYAAMSPDLTNGLFATYSPLSPAPNVQEVKNLYRRDDLRLSGEGSYQLYTDSVSPVPPTPFGGGSTAPKFAGASTDLTHILFQQTRDLTANATGNNVKAYKSDDGVVRLLTAGSPVCPGGNTTTAPCSLPYSGVGEFTPPKLGYGSVSADGSSAEFSYPARGQGLSTTAGVVSRLFQLDDQGTTNTGDDAVIQLNTSERSEPEATAAATFQYGSQDGDRIFFKSAEQLTETPLAGPGATGLYLWERQPQSEVQKVTVNATGGTFTLAAHLQRTVGTGDITEGETKITHVSAGSFMPGESISGPGIPSGTTISSIGKFNEEEESYLTLSQPPTATNPAARLEADVKASTAPLAFNAGAAQVQAALETLTLPAPFEAIPAFGQGNVSVSGGPGGPGGSVPYSISFTGALQGVDVAPLSSDSSALTGVATAQQETTQPVSNLRLVAGDVAEGVGISTNGDRIYFTSNTQLLSGGPDLAGTLGLFYWDGSQTHAGTLYYVGAGMGTGIQRNAEGNFFNQNGAQGAEVTPDGKHLYFISVRGDLVAPRIRTRQLRIVAGGVSKRRTVLRGIPVRRRRLAATPAGSYLHHLRFFGSRRDLKCT